jgi:dynactin 1
MPYRSIAVISDLAENHLGTDLSSFADDMIMRTILMQSHLETTSIALSMCKVQIKYKIDVSSDEDEHMITNFIDKIDTSITNARSAKIIVSKSLRSLQDLRARNLALSQDISGLISKVLVSSEEIAELSRRFGEFFWSVIHSEEGMINVTYTLSTISTSTEKFAIARPGTTEKISPLDAIASQFSSLLVSLSEISLAVSDIENTSEIEDSVPPWVLRSRELAAAKAVNMDTEEEIRLLREEIQARSRDVYVRIKELENKDAQIQVLASRVEKAAKKDAKIKELELQADRATTALFKAEQALQEKMQEIEKMEEERNRAIAQVTQHSKVEVDGEKMLNSKLLNVSTQELDSLRERVVALENANRYIRKSRHQKQLFLDTQLNSWLQVPLTVCPNVIKHYPLAADEQDALRTARKALQTIAGLPKKTNLTELGDQHLKSSTRMMAHKSRKNQSPLQIVV